MANQYKNCIVTATSTHNKTWCIYDDTCYDITSTLEQNKLTSTIVGKTGGVWSDKTASAYVARLPKMTYYDAIDMIRITGKTLEEAVKFFS